MSEVTDKMRADAEIDAELIMKAALTGFQKVRDGEDPRDGLAVAVRDALYAIATGWRETGETLVAARRQGAKGRREQLGFSATIAELAADDLMRWRAAADLSGEAQKLDGWRGPDEDEGPRPIPVPTPAPSGRLLATAGQLDSVTGLRWTSTLADMYNRQEGILAPCSCHGLTLHQRGEAGCLKADGVANRAVAAAMPPTESKVPARFETRADGSVVGYMDSGQILLAIDPARPSISTTRDEVKAVDAAIDALVDMRVDPPTDMLADLDSALPGWTEREFTGDQCACARDQKMYCASASCVGGADLVENQITRDAQLIKDAVVTETHPAPVPSFLSAGGGTPSSSGPSFNPAPLRIAPDPELRTLPRNLSHSALDQAAGCGMKYRLSRVDRLKHAERPSMALIGGIALDAVINEIGRGVPAGYAPGVAFKAELALAVAAKEKEAPQWPIESWHASRSGREDYAWWAVAGTKMAEDYYAWHAGRLRDGWQLVAVQARYESPTAGVPNIGYLDQVWWTADAGYLIVDAKSGSSAPTPDQLMMYGTKLADVLATLSGVPETLDVPRIRAAYYDARKAELGRSFDVASAEVRDEVEFRMESGAQTIAGWHRSGIFPANTNGAYGGCGSCSLKRVCPVGSRR